MAEPAPQRWTLEAFFAWQERQPDRYELVGGFPLKMMAGTRNVHDDIVVNVLAELRRQLRGGPCRPFTADGSVETSKGQIRRPDLGVDCGRRDPNGFKAAEPRLVLEVLSPGTRDFDTFEKLGEYKAVETLDHLVFVEPDMPLLVHWSRDTGREWVRRDVEGFDTAVELADLGVVLRLAEVYDGVAFPPRLRAP
ncbi:Uma2 family endonuclease [Lichenibacterium dinghuense]|uniref:Uma2 family endonuclease n=1 Tax=Lichenibacterium dinghuense TaxID=2895977 RepID=UPI001F26C012|nr:Uma2 family endonuclease [Lichenibacterium sp. 6Y81]